MIATNQSQRTQTRIESRRLPYQNTVSQTEKQKPQSSGLRSQHEICYTASSIQTQTRVETVMDPLRVTETQQKSQDPFPEPHETEQLEDEVVGLVLMLSDERSQKTELTKQLDDSLQQIERLGAGNDRLEAELASTHLELQKDKDRLGQAMYDLKKATEEKEQALKIQRELLQVREEERTFCDDLVKQLERDLMIAHEFHNATREELTTKWRESEERNRDIQLQLADKEVQLDRCRQQVEDKTNLNSSLEVQFNALEKSHGEVQDRHNELLQQFDEVGKQLENKIASVLALETQQQSLKDYIQQRETTFTEATGDYEKRLLQETAKYRDELSKIQGFYEEKVSDLAKSHEHVRNGVQQLSDDLQHQQDDLQRQQDDLQHLTDDLQRQKDDLQYQNDELQRQKDDLQRQKDDFQHQNDDLQRQKNDLQLQSDDLQRQTDDLQRQKNDLQCQSDGLQRQNDDFQRRNEDLQCQNNDLDNENKCKVITIQNLESTMDEIKQMGQKKDTLIQELRDQITENKKMLKDLVESIREQDAMIAKLCTDVPPPEEAVVICADISGSMAGEELVRAKAAYESIVVGIVLRQPLTYLGLLTHGGGVKELQSLKRIESQTIKMLTGVKVSGIEDYYMVLDTAHAMLKVFHTRYPETRLRIIIIGDDCGMMSGCLEDNELEAQYKELRQDGIPVHSVILETDDCLGRLNRQNLTDSIINFHLQGHQCQIVHTWGVITRVAAMRGNFRSLQWTVDFSRF